MDDRTILHTPGGNWWGSNGEEEAIGPFSSRKELVAVLDEAADAEEAEALRLWREAQAIMFARQKVQFDRLLAQCSALRETGGKMTVTQEEIAVTDPSSTWVETVPGHVTIEIAMPDGQQIINMGYTLVDRETCEEVK